MWNEFRPALRFMLWFVGLYFFGNVVYGFYVSHFENTPDAMTVLITRQTAWLLRVAGDAVSAFPNPEGPTVSLRARGEVVLNVYEGCNGINVFIVFMAFVVAFGGKLRNMLWFLPVGLLLLHISNLVRIALLYWTAINYESYFYYVHKYIFTMVLYAVVLGLWMIWVNKFNERGKLEVG